MAKILTYLHARLKEQSTWFGILLVAGSFGLKLSIEQQQAIIYLGMALVGAPTSNLVAVLKGLFGKSEAQKETPQVTQQVAPQVVKNNSIKEVKENDQSKSINDILSDDGSL